MFSCIAEIMQPAGDHTVVIGTADGIEHVSARTPVVYQRRTILPTPSP